MRNRFAVFVCKGLFLSFLLSHQVFTQTSNLGYEVSLLDHKNVESFGGKVARTGYQWKVLNLQIENSIDPFLVFDYDVDESIDILKLQERIFLLSGDGSMYRLHPELFGKYGHLDGDVNLNMVGEKVQGVVAFEVRSSGSESYELHWMDETFASITIPVAGEVPLSLLPVGVTSQENSAVKLAVGEHGSIEIEGIQPRTGMEFYFVDLWGQSKYKQPVKAFFIEEGAYIDEMAESDFYFEYKKADLVLRVVTGEGFSYGYRDDLSLGVEVVPAFISQNWNRERLVFEVPDASSPLRLEALFGKMGLSKGSQKYLKGLVFPLQDGETPPRLLGKEVSFRDSKDANELSVRAALASSPSEWGLDGDQYVAVYVTLENTGSTPGVLEPGKRFWFQSGNEQVFSVSNQYTPSEMLFLDVQRPRTFLLVYERKNLLSSSSLILCYSGIGNYREMEVDLANHALQLIESTGVNPPNDANTNGSFAQASDAPSIESPLSPKQGSPQSSNVPGTMTTKHNVAEALAPEIKLTPYEVELPPFSYHEEAKKQATEAIERMKIIDFLDVLNPSYETFESELGTVAGKEQENNDKWDSASVAILNKSFSGVIEQKGSDYWKIEVPAAVSQENVRYDLLINFPTDVEGFEGLYCSLHSGERQQIVNAWMELEGSYPLRNLKLEAGEYYILIRNYSDQPGAEYKFQLKRRQHLVKVESEPNGWEQEYVDLSIGVPVHGVMGRRDKEDYFRWVVDENLAKKRCDIVVGTDKEDQSFRVLVYDETGETVYWQEQTHNGVSGDFSPVAGTYYVRLEANPDEPFRYQLQVVQRGDAQEGWEREPNDIMLSRTMVVVDAFDDSKPELLGRLEGRYGDFFALEVKDQNSLYHVTVGGPEKISLSYYDYRRGKMGTVHARKGNPAAFVDLRLPMGLNYFEVKEGKGDYAVNIQQVPIPGATFEWEPNNSAGQGRIIQPGLDYQGRLLSNYDDDFYRFVVHQAMFYRFRLKSPEASAMQLNIQSPGFSGQRQHTSPESPTIDYRVWLLPGSYNIHLEAYTPSDDFYELRVDPDPTPEGMLAGDLDGLQIESLEQTLTVAAFNDDFQEAIHTVKLINYGTVDRDVSLITATSNHRVKYADSTPASLRINAGESKTLQIPWMVLPQLPGSEDVRVFVGIEEGGTVEFTSAMVDGSPDVIADRILPGQQQLLDRFAGGVNVNGSAIGAVPIREPQELYGDHKIPPESYLKQLIDGVLANRSFYGHAAVIQMQGQGTTEIVGTAIELHGRASLWESAKDFSIDISNDGIAFTEIFEGSLQPRTGEQFFAFETPVHAKFSRIRLHNTHSGKENQVPHLGEWSMIANPLKPVSGFSKIDLLEQKHGGHWIHGINDERSRVYGFQHNRAARLSSLYWENKDPGGYRGNSHQVVLEISEESPVGPWEKYGTFDLSAADHADSLSVEHVFKDEPWARFVKISWDASDHSNGTNAPSRIALFEKEITQDYRSAIGEWQGATPFAYPEYLEKQKGQKTAVALTRIESSKTEPYALMPDTWVESVAWINEGWDDWYVIEPVEVKKQLQFAIEANPFVKVAVDLVDAAGQKVPLKGRSKGANRKEFSFLADAGVAYKVHVYEPKRSIVYLWDVSGSMGQFIESIESAVLGFAQEIDPLSEKVQLLPFDEPPQFLLDQWSSDSYELQSTVRTYKAPGSSYAHLNLKAASQLLEKEEGTKAAIVITDCESPRNVNPELWETLQKVKPAVFTFQTSDQTSGYTIEQDDMQDWAAVAGGFYHNTKAVHELDEAFEKVKAYLRRPAPYKINLTAPELKLSYISVKDRRDSSEIRRPGEDAVVLILDASASMRESLPNGQTKVAAAKAVLNDLVVNYLPEGVNFGLRVFGHRGSENCLSDLLIPVAPLDAGVVKQKLMRVVASSLGNTAIAEALSFADEDLKDFSGIKRVVVLTDGEETCRGDPAAEISALAEMGLDVTVNIVGFALNDDNVKADYANWVASTAGQYYDAQKLDDLVSLLHEAMAPVEMPTFEIYDNIGTLVATGKIGESDRVEVSSGVYTVKILDDDKPYSETVEAFETHVTVEYR